MKRLAAALVMAGALVGFGQVADAYPPDAPTITVDDSTPAAGGQFTVTVTCEDPEQVTFTFQGQTQAVTCSGGTASASFAAPNAAGTYTVSAQLAVTGVTVTTEITVTADPTTPGLPATGGGAGMDTTLWIAGGLLVAGAGMFVVAESRRRRTPATVA